MIDKNAVDITSKACMEGVCENCNLVTSYGYRRQAMTILCLCGASHEERMALGDWQQMAPLTGSGLSAMPARYAGQKNLMAVCSKNKVMAIHQELARRGLRTWDEVTPLVWHKLGAMVSDKPIGIETVWRHPNAKELKQYVLIPPVPNAEGVVPPEATWPWHCKDCGAGQPFMHAVQQAGGKCTCGSQEWEQRKPLPHGQIEDVSEEVPFDATHSINLPEPMPSMLGGILLRPRPRFPPQNGDPIQPYCVAHQHGKGADGTAALCNRRIVKWATRKDGSQVPLQCTAGVHQCAAVHVGGRACGGFHSAIACKQKVETAARQGIPLIPDPPPPPLVLMPFAKGQPALLATAGAPPQSHVPGATLA